VVPMQQLAREARVICSIIQQIVRVWYNLNDTTNDKAVPAQGVDAPCAYPLISGQAGPLPLKALIFDKSSGGGRLLPLEFCLIRGPDGRARGREDASCTTGVSVVADASVVILVSCSRFARVCVLVFGQFSKGGGEGDE